MSEFNTNKSELLQIADAVAREKLIENDYLNLMNTMRLQIQAGTFSQWSLKMLNQIGGYILILVGICMFFY